MDENTECPSGKKCFDKEGAQGAKNARLTPRRHGRRKRAKVPKFLRIYHCDQCNWWHLTHMRKYTPPDTDS